MMIRLLTLILCSSVLSWGKLTPEQREKLPPPAAREVDFKKDIQPIFEASCIKCHGRGKDKGGFAIDNREKFLKGGDEGPVALPGKSDESLIVEMVSGLDPDNVMPQKGSKLTAEQVGLLRKWIDQGVQWDPEITFGKLPPKNLHVNKPSLPEVAGIENPIDRFVWKYFETERIKPASPVEDRTYARRVYLDTIGLLPTPRELDQFTADKSPDKRSKLVRSLLDRKIDYATHWLTFWNDALRNDYKGTGYIDGGRKQITSWLFASLVQNKPYDKFVSELIHPNSESEGFSRGIVWRGVVNASQAPPMQAAQNISQVFMGVNLKCASCHDSFINDWTLADSYGLASIYSDEPLEMFRCDKPTGKKAAMRFLYPELGEISSAAPKEQRLEKLADIVTSKENGRLTRTMVNRLWARFLGHGLVEPVDELDNPSWNQDLLDWLAADLTENSFDLKHTIQLILSSRAYQLPSVPVGEIQSKDFAFKGPLIRRLSAEQFIDGISEVTERWDKSPAAGINFAAVAGEKISPDFDSQPFKPKWIWKDQQAAQKTDPVTIYLRKIVQLSSAPQEAEFLVSCDNSFKLYINGREAGSGKDHTKPSLIDGRQFLREGINLIAIAANNQPGDPKNPEADQRNPAGLWVYARVRAVEPDGTKKIMDLGSDSSWIWTLSAEDGWEKPEFAAANWSRTVELGNSDVAPWKLGTLLAQSVANLEYLKEVRASLVNNDPLMAALGRPNREQVVTTRPSDATTLQALELTNGRTLDSELKNAAQAFASKKIAASELVTDLYKKAFGREPTPQELTLSKEMLGSPVKPEGVEDLLWAMAMLPEFQLIY
jgi:mono/diheme cytochrome c family protein